MPEGASGDTTTETESSLYDLPLKKTRQQIHRIQGKLKTEWKGWSSFFQLCKEYAVRYMRTVSLYIMVPALVAAAILFYFCDNPMSDSGALISWWLLFIGVRQIVTLSFGARDTSPHHRLLGSGNASHAASWRTGDHTVYC